jgi:transaldolase
MNITAIFTGIVAIAKAVPVIASYIDRFYEFYIDYQISKIDKYRIEKRDKRKALMKAITKAGSDEERKALSIVLNDINNM